MMGEKSSETLPKDARVRHLAGRNPDLGFKETIMTFNYNASADEKCLAYCNDDTWVNMNGISGRLRLLVRKNTTTNTSKYHLPSNPIPSLGTSKRTVNLKGELRIWISKGRREASSEC